MERTLTEHQFHIVWTEAVEMEGYNKKLFQNILQSLKNKGIIKEKEPFYITEKGLIIND